MLASSIPPPPLSPPPVGQSFADPSFGTRILRVTDARAAGVDWVGTEYATICPFNADASLLLLLAVDHFQLFSANGTFLRDLPLAASCEPRWSRAEPEILYYLLSSVAVVVRYNVQSGRVAPRMFPEYERLSGRGESDLSPDGSMVLIGDDAEVFVYSPLTDTKGPVLDVTGNPVESLYITSRNEVLISWADAAPDHSGIELYSEEMALLRQVTSANGHKAVGVDADGSPIMVWTNSNERGADSECPNGIEKINLATGDRACLLPLDWSLAVNIAAAPGCCIVSTYAPAPHGWPTYANEILRVPLDGSPVTRLCHHRSAAADYTSQPRATCSRDGSRIVFGSDWGGTTDAYLIAENAPLSHGRRPDSKETDVRRRRPIERTGPER